MLLIHVHRRIKKDYKSWQKNWDISDTISHEHIRNAAQQNTHLEANLETERVKTIFCEKLKTGF